MRKLILVTLIVLSWIICFGIGVFYKQLPFLEVDYRINILDFIWVAVTIFLAIGVPYILTSRLDDRRYLKGYLTDEIKHFIVTLETIDDKMAACCKSKSTTEEDKKELLFKFTKCNREISSLKTQMHELFKSQTYPLRDLMSDHYKEYWRVTTGGDLMNQGYAIDFELCNKSSRALSRLQSTLKKLIHAINDA